MKIRHEGHTVEVRDADCPRRDCFVPGRYEHEALSGRQKPRKTWSCTLRDRHGCPELRDAEIHDLKVELAIYRRTLIRILDWCRYQGDWRDLKPGEIAVLIEMDLKEYGK